MNSFVVIILLHQLIFQGLFLAKNISLRVTLKRPIRGNNKEANISVAFFALFICLSVYEAAKLPENDALLQFSLPQVLIALLLMCTNVILGAASLRDLGDSWRVGVIEEQETALVASGVYRYTRNPYFVAYLLMFAAYTILLQSILLCVLSVAGALLVHWMILKEERFLSMSHGDAYRNYRQRVPRYL